MSFNEVIKKIEDKLEKVNEQLKSHNSYVVDIANAIEKLVNDKATTNNNINIISGAIQAYTDVLSLLKELNSKDIEQAGQEE